MRVPPDRRRLLYHSELENAQDWMQIQPKHGVLKNRTKKKLLIVCYEKRVESI